MSLLYPSIRARYLFHEVRSLQIGHSTFEDGQRLAKKLGATPSGSGLDPCNRSYCYWSVNVSNSRLPQWWRGSGVTFSVDFLVENSVVVNRGGFYAIGIDPYNSFTPFMVSVGEQRTWLRMRPEDHRVIPEPPTSKGWKISYFERNGYREFNAATFRVYLTPRSSAEDWGRYTAFNFSCFWRYKGCKDARDLLPTADPYPDDYKDLRQVAR
jgi:hypothetical protein